MPIRIAIDESAGQIDVTVQGTVTDDEVIATVRRTLADPRFPRGARILTDSRLRLSTLTPAAVRVVVEELRAHRELFEGARCALVAADTASFGVQRMLAIRSESIPFEVCAFRDLDDARAWLRSDSGDDEGGGG